MELYLIVTRPELVLSASELREMPGIRRLDEETSKRVLTSIRSRTQLVVRATDALSGDTEAKALPDFNVDTGRYTIVPADLIPLAYGDAPYFEFIAAYKRYCARLNRGLLPSAFRVAPELSVLPSIRDKELKEFAAGYFRRQNRAIRTAYDKYFSAHHAAHDMLASAMRTRREEALQRVRERYPVVKAGSAVHKALVALDVQSTRASPLVQALMDSCAKMITERLPRPPRVPMLIPRDDLQRLVQQALTHSKLIRLLRLTATDIPPGFSL